MSKRVTLPGGEQLDMGDHEAIRNHALRMIAEISVQETGFHQTRLAAAKELLEVADRLEAKQKTPASNLRLIDPKAAAAELQRRLDERGGGK